MQRDTGGVVRIQAEDLTSALRQLGVAHASDRPAQMALMRILARGQACECLADEPELLELDRCFRWLDLCRGAQTQVSVAELIEVTQPPGAATAAVLLTGLAARDAPSYRSKSIS